MTHVEAIHGEFEAVAGGAWSQVWAYGFLRWQSPADSPGLGLGVSSHHCWWFDQGCPYWRIMLSVSRERTDASCILLGIGWFRFWGLPFFLWWLGSYHQTLASRKGTILGCHLQDSRRSLTSEGQAQRIVLRLHRSVEGHPPTQK